MSLKAEGAYSDGEMAFKLEVGDHAWWSTFSHMAEVNLVFLKQFKKSRRTGIPGSVLVDRYGDPRDLTDAEFARAIKEWDATLDKMIKAFELIILDNNDLPAMAVVDERDTLIEDGLLEFAIHFRSLWD